MGYDTKQVYLHSIYALPVEHNPVKTIWFLWRFYQKPDLTTIQNATTTFNKYIKLVILRYFHASFQRVQRAVPIQ